MKLPNIRTCYALGLLICLGMLGFAIYLQMDESLAPCPLCQLQRLVFILMGILFLIAAIQRPGPRGTKTYGYFFLLLALIGGSIALRQLWLQNTPQPIDENCGVGMNYLLNALPLTEAIKMILKGTGDCAQVHWRFLGLTIPGWSLLGFSVLGLLGIWQNFRVNKQA